MRAGRPRPRCSDAARLALDEQAVGDQRVEVAADGGGGEAELLGERRGGLRAALEDEAGDRVAGTAASSPARARRLEFHNISMTYFRSGAAPTPA